MSFSRGTTRVSQPLSNVAFDYKSNKFIWQNVLKPVPVTKETDTYYEFTGKDFEKYYDLTRPDGTQSARVKTLNVSTDTYTCVEKSGHDIVTDRQRNNQDSIVRLDQRVTKALVDLVDMNIEVASANNVFNNANYTNKITLPAAQKWDKAAATIQANIATAQDAILKTIGIEGNTLVVGNEVHKVLRRSNELSEKLKYTQTLKGSFLSNKQIAEALEVQNYVVGTGRYSLSGVSTYIWGKNAALIYVPETSAIDEPAFGYTFMHTLFGGLTAMVEKWRERKLRGDWIEVTRSFDSKLTGKDAGYYFNQVIT
jgi:hypothetical protein